MVGGNSGFLKPKPDTSIQKHMRLHPSHLARAAGIMLCIVCAPPLRSQSPFMPAISCEAPWAFWGDRRAGIVTPIFHRKKLRHREAVTTHTHTNPHRHIYRDTDTQPSKSLPASAATTSKGYLLSLIFFSSLPFSPHGQPVKGRFPPVPCAAFPTGLSRPSSPSHQLRIWGNVLTALSSWGPSSLDSIHHTPARCLFLQQHLFAFHGSLSLRSDL